MSKITALSKDVRFAELKKVLETVVTKAGNQEAEVVIGLSEKKQKHLSQYQKANQ